MTMVAQGNALGAMDYENICPEGAKQRRPFCGALSGREIIWNHLTQGVALGYHCVGLSAR
jgi:hypothetical protein